jgi:hypothetical protein
VALPGVGTFCIGPEGAGRDGASANGFRKLDVRRVVGAGTPRDRVFSRFGEHLEFVRRAAADLARVGGDRAELELHPAEDARHRRRTSPGTTRASRLVDVERVRVLHHELARAHHAEARAHFVAKLGLDVIEVERQLLVAAQLLARDVGDDFLGGRLHDEVALVPVLERSSSGRTSSQRPLSCHILGGWRTGISSSMAPARFISSRTMASTLRSTRSPSGIHV